jgi:hypothetical protein
MKGQLRFAQNEFAATMLPAHHSPYSQTESHQVSANYTWKHPMSVPKKPQNISKRTSKSFGPVRTVARVFQVDSFILD